MVVHRLFARNTVEDSIQVFTVVSKFRLSILVVQYQYFFTVFIRMVLQVVQERRRRMFESRASDHEDIATSSNTREMMEIFGLVHLLQ